MASAERPNVVRLFEEQAALRPDSVALILNGKRLTYRELNERANQLAHYLIDRGVECETLAGVCLRRSLEMVVALLGILKAGGAYLPLDPDYPSERLAFMIKDTRAAVVLTDTRCAAAFPANSAAIVRLDTDAPALASASTANPDLSLSSSNLIYVMYTSGSTGQPKGVMIEHRGVVRLVKNTNYANLDSSERFLQMAPISFDASTLEIWAPLLNGGSLVLMPPGPISLEGVGETIRRHQVTSAWLPTGLFNLMIDQHPDGLRPLRQLITGGDAGSAVHFRKALEKLPGVRLINGYGPTETTTFAVCLTARSEHLSGSSVPIGYPIANTEVLILDPELNPVSSGETGEIFIGGDGLARGYLNRHELTAQRFLVPPWACDRPLRLYRTGDRGRSRDNGMLDYLGRTDDQVKVSGYRVEPGEVVAALREHRGVADAAVIAEPEPGGHKRLIAYVVPAQHLVLRARELREFLQASLPQFMMPADFVMLDRIPLTANGKVDRSALRRPALSAAVPPVAAGGGTIEATIASVWCEVLRRDSVAPHANFFDLGGDSLQLISAYSKLQTALKRKFAVSELFEFPTVSSLAGHLASGERVAALADDVQARARRQREMLARRAQSPRTA